MSSPPLTDAQAREAARTTFDHPVIVEAGAGTGKTTTLIARILTWCLGPGWDAASDRPDTAARVLDGVVAITFTKAAAAEMADRFCQALHRVATGQQVMGVPSEVTSSAQAAERARALQAVTDRLRFNTIHSWCSSLLSSAPLDVGLHPAFVVDADNAVLEQLVLEVVIDGFTATFDGEEGPLAEPLLLLGERGVGPGDLATSLSLLAQAGVPSDALSIAHYDTGLVASLYQRIDLAVQDVLTLVGPVVTQIARRVPKARQLTIELSQLADRARTAPTTQQGLAELAVAAAGIDLSRLSAWGKGDFGKNELRVFAPVSAQLRRACSQANTLLRHVARQDPLFFEAARTVLSPWLADVEERLRARGAIPFAWLLRDTRALLASRPGVRSRVRSGIDLLLVDEFQDTDAVQCEIVRLLALTGPPEQRPSLFVVGDPKQSIYGWRSADLQAYEAFVGVVRDAGGQVLYLSVNRRSTQPILDEVERVLQPIMQRRPGIQPAFQVLELGRGDAPPLPEGFAAVEHWDSSPFNGNQPAEGPRAAELSRVEARAIAQDMARLHGDHGAKWSDLALLMRSTGDLELYLAALRDEGVPYAVERDKSYFRRRETIDATALVRCILQPSDPLALLTTLRSPVVGVPDAALVPLWKAGLPEQLARLHEPGQLGPLLALVDQVRVPTTAGAEQVAGWKLTLKRALSLIAELRAAYETTPVDTWVERLRTGLPIEAVASARYLGSYRLANLDRFFRQLCQALQVGGPHETLRALVRSVSEGSDAEEARPFDTSQDAVRVMTIHKAKGLDFGHVYVAQLHKKEQRGPPGRTPGERTEAAHVQGDWHMRLLGAPGPTFDVVEERNRQVEAAERVRLLYVALTRAKDRLVMLGHKKGLDAIPTERAECLLDLLAHRGPRPQLADLTAEDLIAQGALWRAPGRDQGTEAVPLPSRSRTPPDLVGIGTDVGLLDRQRQAARGRMARPFSAAASARAHDVLSAAWGHDPSDSSERGHGETRGYAMDIGTAVHRALEHMDLAAPADRQLSGTRRQLREWLESSVPQRDLRPAVERAWELVRVFCSGRLGARARGLEIVARELHLLAPPGDDGPVGFLAGAIDLVYLDPDDGRIVVVDYKTDRVDDPATLQQRAEAYALQGAIYAEAVQRGLDLPYRPRVELWFLGLDRSVPVA